MKTNDKCDAVATTDTKWDFEKGHPMRSPLKTPHYRFEHVQPSCVEMTYALKGALTFYLRSKT